ncbi:MAG: MBL fold metallo-hydrolase [Candidatus Pacearchaeota archaeon]
MLYNNIEIEWLGHASIYLKYKNKIIYIDPYILKAEKEKADIILITHNHYDHCSIADIKKIVKKETTIIIPPDCQSSINKINIEISTKILEPKSSIKIDDIKILAFPSYNINKPYHPKEENWNGYIIDINGTIIYHAGDSDLIKEMENLKEKIDIAFLPVGGVYTMNAKEAAEAANIIKPKLAIPIHYGSIIGAEKDALDFVKLCKEKNINSLIL